MQDPQRKDPARGVPILAHIGPWAGDPRRILGSNGSSGGEGATRDRNDGEGQNQEGVNGAKPCWAGLRQKNKKPGGPGFSSETLVGRE